MAPGIPSPHPTGRHAPPSWTLPRGNCGRPRVLLAPRELWDPPRCVVVPKNPALWWGSGSVLPRHPPIPGVPRPHPLAAGQRLHGGVVHSVGGPHRQGALDRPRLRFPVRLMALCGLQRIHHGPGGTPGTGGLAPRRPHTSMPRCSLRPRPPPPPPPSLLAPHRHLARRPAGPSGCSGRTRCGHVPRHRRVAQSPTGTPRLFLPRGPTSPRRPAPSTPRPARLPPRLR